LGPVAQERNSDFPDAAKRAAPVAASPVDEIDPTAKAIDNLFAKPMNNFRRASVCQAI
jgi:hypothetical protein